MSVKKVSDFGLAPDFGPVSDLSPSSLLGLREAGRRFINSYRAAGYSESYVKGLEETIGYLVHYSEERGWAHVSHITTQHLEEYFAYSRTRKKGYGERKITGAETLSSSYLDKQYRQLRRFWAWMVEARWVPVNVNVLDIMQRPRVEEKVVPTVSDEQIQDLLAILDPRLARTQVEKFYLLRNCAVIRLFVDTPGRLQEIATMEVTDLFLEDKGDERIEVMGKGRRQRFMPIRRAAGRVLADYLEARERLFPVTHDLWVSDQGEAMEVNWLYLMVKRLGKRANVPHLRPHMFRHTFAMNALRNGMPEEYLKILGGWRKIPETYFRTMGYEDAAAFYRSMSQGDRMSQQTPSRRRGGRGSDASHRARGRL